MLMMDSSETLPKAIADYLSDISLDFFSYKFQNKIYGSQPYELREDHWKKLNLPFKKVRKKFKVLAKARNQLAKNNGYHSYLEFILNHDKIPQSNLKQFIKDIDRTIEHCNQSLPKIDLPNWFYSEFNLPCFICETTSFPFDNLDNVFNFVAQQFPVLEKNKNRISIIHGDNTQMIYKQETNIFQITINKNFNNRHQTIGLIHELGHVISQLTDMDKSIDPVLEGKYHGEKGATEIEFTTLKKISPLLFQAYLAEILFSIHRILFEIELYHNPEQDFDLLYAQTFNKCFHKANQKTNPLYLVNEHIVLKPLSGLAQIIAQTESLDIK